MPVMVIFEPPDCARRPASDSFTLGPYRVAQLAGDVLCVYERLQPVRLATRNSDGFWEVNGLDGLVFESVRFMPPTDEAKAELDQAIADYDSEHSGE